MAVAVVGSGPSGVAAASALLDRGEKVTLLDVGITLEASRTAVAQQMANLDPLEWTSEQTSYLFPKAARGSGVPRKLKLGSNYPYRDAAFHPPLINTTGLEPSFARGGLSSVWGAAVAPYRQSDVSDWPIAYESLAYGPVMQILGLHAEKSDISISRQAASMWDTISKNGVRLGRAGIQAELATVAIQTRDGDPQSHCKRCGMCLDGCPYGSIYDAARTLEKLRLNPSFSHIADFVVAQVHETADDVTVRGFRRDAPDALSFSASRVLLACGVVPTTTILLRSMAAYDRPVSILDSQYFLAPAVLLKSVPNVREERIHALSQLFVGLLDPKISTRWVHLQIYSYSPWIGQAVASLLRGRVGRIDALARLIEQRSIVLQGYLHSDDSGQMLLELTRRHGREEVLLAPRPNCETRGMVRRVLYKLLWSAPALGAAVLPPMAKVADVGRGFHCGGSFPMRKDPGCFESDTLGRPHGWTRVHAVDATVLPSIPSRTITCSVMANAYRIAAEVAALH